MTTALTDDPVKRITKEQTSFSSTSYRRVVERPASRYARTIAIETTSTMLLTIWATLGVGGYFVQPLPLIAWPLASLVAVVVALLITARLVRVRERELHDAYIELAQSRTITTQEERAIVAGRRITFNRNANGDLAMQSPDRVIADNMVLGKWVEALQDAIEMAGDYRRVIVSRKTLKCGGEQERKVRDAFYRMGWMNKANHRLTPTGYEHVRDWSIIPTPYAAPTESLVDARRRQDDDKTIGGG